MKYADFSAGISLSVFSFSRFFRLGFLFVILPSVSLAKVSPSTPTPPNMTKTSDELFNDKVIYGEDNRQELDQYHDQKFIELGRSTAVMVGRSSLTQNRQDGSYQIKGKNLVSGAGVCTEEPFSDQLAPGRCSGFLVAPDLLVTAGHCVTGSYDCSTYSWVFDFKIHQDHPERNYKVNSNDVYNCKEVVERKLDSATQDDYALIRLTSAVTNRTPLTFRKTGTIAPKANIIVIGHPSGLPVKIADGAQVRTNTDPYFFTTNLDTYGGNSGSAVFNADDGVVEGILVRGETDFEYVPGKSCRMSKICSEDGCRGEDVTRITNIKTLLGQSVPPHRDNEDNENRDDTDENEVQ
jgi:V8-like Glu-specific endopeptidase